ncbi:MAG: dethiobiotin synthase [bacterium]
MHKGVFITGTDTNVGKTFVAACLLSYLRKQGYNYTYMKPFQSGSVKQGGKLFAPDLDFVLENTKLDGDYDLLNPVRLELPLAPSVAARIEGRDIDVDEVYLAYQTLQENYTGVLVEGAGGLIVPLFKNYLITDLIKKLKLPIVIVARAGLGTINHTLLTVKVAKELGIEILGIIINGFNRLNKNLAELTNPEVIAELTDVPILGIIPYISRLEDGIKNIDIANMFSDNINCSVIHEKLAEGEEN